MRKLLLFGLLVVGSSLLLFGLGQKQPKANQSASVVWKAPEGKAEDYAGAETCGICHSSHSDAYLKTAHAKAAPAKAAVGAGCESCHGPGKAHAEAMADAGADADKVASAKKLIFGFRGNPAQNSERCLSCHI